MLRERIEAINETLSELRAFRRQLAESLERCEKADGEACPVVLSLSPAKARQRRGVVRVERMATAGSVVSGVLASACCIGPLVLGLLGISGAAFAQRFEPFWPYLLVVTYALLGSAFYLTYRPQAACGPGTRSSTDSGTEPKKVAASRCQT